MTKRVTINKKQRLFVFHEAKWISCLGFDVCQQRSEKLARELGREMEPTKIGTHAAYQQYQKLLKIAADKHRATGWKSKSELIPEFIGRENERVEIETNYGEISRFYIGKSTGFVPCHIELKRRDSSGGSAVCGYPFKKIKFLGVTR